MALSKLNPLFSVFSPQTPNPAVDRSTSTNIHIKPLKTRSIPKLETHFTIPVLIPEPKRSLQEYKIPSDSNLSVAFPSLAFSNTLLFSSTYNVQVFVGNNEPEETLVARFRREVFKAGVFRECKKRRRFESTRLQKKRKSREAAKRYRKRRPQPRVSKQAEAKEEPRKERYESDDDNWAVLDVEELPYTR